MNETKRYGENSVHEYKHNLPKAISELTKVLPMRTLFIWTTTMPLAKEIKGGFMIPECEHLTSNSCEHGLKND